MQKKFPLSKIKPNPFRILDHYPIDEDKVQALVESYVRTGYWGNVVGRPVDDGIEIAYGHHRREAWLRSLDPAAEVEIIVRKLSDEDMIKVMADENMTEWRTSSVVEQETVRAVVEAYAATKIDLPELDGNTLQTKKNTIRYAPSFVKGRAPESGARPYTADTVAEFLGWQKKNRDDKSANERVLNALKVLETAEKLGLEEELKDITEGMSSTQGAAAAKAVEDIKEAYETAGLKPEEAKREAVKKVKETATRVKETERGKREGPAGAGGVRDLWDTAERVRISTTPEDKRFEKFRTKHDMEYGDYLLNVLEHINTLCTELKIALTASKIYTNAKHKETFTGKVEKLQQLLEQIKADFADQQPDRGEVIDAGGPRQQVDRTYPNGR